MGGSRSSQYYFIIFAAPWLGLVVSAAGAALSLFRGTAGALPATSPPSKNFFHNKVKAMALPHWQRKRPPYSGGTIPRQAREPAPQRVERVPPVQNSAQVSKQHSVPALQL